MIGVLHKRTTLLLCLGLLIVHSTCDLEKYSLGDPCTLTSNNATGDCVLLRNCPKAIENFQNGILPQICTILPKQRNVVCCERETPRSLPGEISEQKCKEYGKAVYELQYPPVFALNVKPLEIDTCAVVVAPLVIGGEDANPSEFPHMALLGYKKEQNIAWKCGGTLISEQYVLTAGHCLRTEFGPLEMVRLGELNINSNNDDSEPQDFSVLELIKHPQYEPPMSYNDIALVKLKDQVKFNRFIRPACLHTTTYINTTRYIVTGWGDTSYSSMKGSDILQKVVLDSFSQDTCNATYGNMSKRKLRNGILPDTQMCAGGADAKKDTCQGDSGGPLQIYHKEVYCMYSIVGVTSFGKACGFIGIPGIYTRVSSYIDWIEKTVWS